jgi:predicted phosphodiesterase
MTDEEISALIGDDPADLVICGGSHVPFDRVVSGVRVINVGSVGEAPSGQAPAAFGGRPVHADATVIETRKGDKGFEIHVEQFVVPLGKAA